MPKQNFLKRDFLKAHCAHHLVTKMISSSVKLIRSDVITAARLRHFGPFSNCNYRPNHQSCKPERLSLFNSRACSRSCSNLSKPVHQKVGKEPDDEEDDELRGIAEPAKSTFRNGSEYTKTFRRLLQSELDHELLHKASAETEKDIRKRYDSELKALARFEKNEDKLNPTIYQIILGKQKIAQLKSEDQQLDLNAYQTPVPIQLNQSQAFAIKHTLENQFTLIQGRL